VAPAAPLSAASPLNPVTSPSATPIAVKSVSATEVTFSHTSVDGGPVMAASADQRVALAPEEAVGPVAEVAMLSADQSIPEPPQEVMYDAGTRSVLTPASSASVAVQPSLTPMIAQVTDAQFSQLEGRVATLEGQIDTLFDLSATVDRNAQRGIASIAAQANPHFPSEAGKTSYASNVATYRGEVGISAGLMHRFEGDFAITAGVTYAGGNSTSVRAGIAGEF
jgi:autotransporter adhesin